MLYNEHAKKSSIFIEYILTNSPKKLEISDQELNSGSSIRTLFKIECDTWVFNKVNADTLLSPSNTIPTSSKVEMFNVAIFSNNPENVSVCWSYKTTDTLGKHASISIPVDETLLFIKSNMFII